MPGKSGVECARIIQDMDPTMVLIFATAMTSTWAMPLRSMPLIT